MADEFGSSGESLTPEPSSAGLDTHTDTVADDLESTAASSTPEHRGAPPELDTDTDTVADDFESSAESLTPQPSSAGLDTDTDTVADDLESTAASSTPEHRGAPPELDTGSNTVTDEVGFSPE